MSVVLDKSVFQITNILRWNDGKTTELEQKCTECLWGIWCTEQKTSKSGDITKYWPWSSSCV